MQQMVWNPLPAKINTTVAGLGNISNIFAYANSGILD